MAGREDHPKLSIESPADLRTWLEQNHASAQGVWLVRYRKAARPELYVSQEEVVRELLCFGWIDSLFRKLDEERNSLLLTPRRPGSNWSRTNKRLVDELEAQGLMRPAGRAVIDAAKADGSWTVLDDVDDLVIPDDLEAALAALPGARRTYESWTQSQKKGVLWAVKSARKPATRARRIEGFARKAASGERPF